MTPAIGRVVHVALPDRKQIFAGVITHVCGSKTDEVMVAVFDPGRAPYNIGPINHETFHTVGAFWRWPPWVA